MQTWATFSIIDHRKPIYRQSLALFDRIVVPIPPRPIGDQTKQELDQLEADVAYLEGEGAARRYEWDSDQFWEWQAPFVAEGLAGGLNRDLLQDTRVMLAKNMEADDVQAIPVYGGMEEYGSTRKALRETCGDVDHALTLEITQSLPVPGDDIPLENLVRLRASPAFRQALEDLLEWKRQHIPAIVLEENRRQAMDEALLDFDKRAKEYARAMKDEGYHNAGKVASVFVTMLTGEAIGVIKEGLTTFCEVREPRWKKLSGMKCAPGAVVYHFNEALR